MQAHAQAALSRVRGQYQALPLGTLSIAFLCVGLQCVSLVLSCILWVLPSSHWLAASSSLLETVALVPSQVLPPHYQFWSVLTAAFFHAGVLHVAFNTLCLVSVGAMLELRAGTALFVQLSLILVVCSGCIYVGAAYASSLLFSSSWLSVGCVGYSGVLFGYLGVVAFLPDAPAQQALCGMVNVPTRLYPFVLLLAIQIVVPNVSLLGHLSGLIAGCLYSAGALSWLHCGPALLRSAGLKRWAVGSGRGGSSPAAEGTNLLLPQHHHHHHAPLAAATTTTTTTTQEAALCSRFVGCPAAQSGSDDDDDDARAALRGDFLWIRTAFSNFLQQARTNKWKWVAQVRGLLCRTQIDESDARARAGSQLHGGDDGQTESGISHSGTKANSGAEKTATAEDTRLWVGQGYKLGGSTGGTAPKSSSRREATRSSSSARTSEKPTRRPDPGKEQVTSGSPQRSVEEHGSNTAAADTCSAGAEEVVAAAQQPLIEEVDSSTTHHAE